MQLSPSEMRVFQLVELEADLPATEIARRARLKAPTVQRILTQARERGLIVGRTAVIDLSRLGLLECGIFLSCNGTETDREKLIQTLKQRKEVSWIAELGGEWDIGCNLIVSHPKEAAQFLSWLTKQSANLLSQYEICYRLERVRLTRTALFSTATGNRSQIKFHSGASVADNTSKKSVSAQEQLDQIDRAVLDVLSQSTHESFRELAAQAQIPVATFLRRMQQLRERKILLGFGYRFDLDHLSIQQYRLFFRSTQNHDLVWSELLRFGKETGRIKLLARTLGSWCVEGECDVRSPTELKNLLKDVRRLLVPLNSSVEAHPILQHRKYVSFPAVLPSV